MKKDKYINVAFYVVIVLILVVFMVFIIGKLISSKNIDNQDGDGELLQKIDDNKDYVYDALYNLDVDKDSYFVYDNTKEIKASDIVVPYINIISKDVKRINIELHKLYEELINQYNKNLIEGISYTLVEYESYINNNILSVVVWTERAGTSLPIYQYYTYNIDLNTGNLLGYDDVLSKIDLNRDSALELVGNVLSDYIHNICGNEYCNSGNFTYEMFYNLSRTMYLDKVTEGSLNYFIKDNQLYVVLNPQFPAQSSGFDKLFNINSGEEIR